jgi:hypothetical protein
MRAERFPAPPAANLHTNAQKIIKEGGVSWFFGTKYIPERG